MPQCSFKSCKNNSRKMNSSVGVSYFRFPTNPFKCAEWISIVARERNEEFYKPAKCSVLCSEHFDKSEIIGNSFRRRLVKSALPKLPEMIKPPPEDLQSVIDNTSNTKPSESDIAMPLAEDSNLVITPKVEIKEEEEQEQTIYVVTSPVEPLSDLLIRPETPRKTYLKKQLDRAREIIKVKTRRIQTLQKVNKRLVKKVGYFKNIINSLRIKYKNKREFLDGLNQTIKLEKLLRKYK